LGILLLFNNTVYLQTKKTQAQNMCEQWIEKVDPSSGKTNIDADSTLSDNQIIEAITCLLKCEGNKNTARISGATHLYISQIFPQATIELAALYYISYLFTRSWDIADGIALCDNNGTINPPKSIETAYEKYKEWFQKVQSIGIKAAREQKLNPLAGSGIHWYGAK
jgi:hypothetical protein